MASTAVVPVAAPVAPAVPKTKAAAPKAVKKIVAGKKGGKKNKKLRFEIDCTVPTTDGVMDSSSFEKFLAEHIKVNGKIGNLADQVMVRRHENKIMVTSRVPMSKRYVKYLSKKYLKKKNLKDFMRLVATSKSGFAIKYYNINQGDTEADEE